MPFVRWLLTLREFAQLHSAERANRMRGDSPRLDPKRSYWCDPKQRLR